MRGIMLILFLSAYCIYAQKTIYVADEQGNPVPAVKILVINSKNDSTFFLTSLNGSIQIPLEKTRDKVVVAPAGFEPYHGIISTDSIQRITLYPKVLDAVCVTAQYTPTSSVNAIQKITVIPKDKIEQSGANNLNDLLTYQTGIRLTQDNILGSSMDLSGISGQNVKILIDGIPVIGRQNGNIDLNQINLNNVERIEIVEGPLSVNYGSNALAGTINIITKKSAKDGINIMMNPYYESIGNYNFNLSTGIKVNKHQFLINVGRNYFDGWSESDAFFQFPKKRLADTNRFKTWKPKEQYFGEVQYTTSLKGWQINPYGRYFQELIINRGFPTTPYYETAFDDYYRTKRMDFGISFDKQLQKSHLLGQLAYNQFYRVKNTYYKDLTTLTETLSETSGAQDTSRFSLLNGRLTYQTNRKKKFDYEVGLDINYETAWGVRINNGYQEIGDYALYTTAEWKPIRSVIIKPGLRYAYNTKYKAPVAPSINIRFRKNNFTIRTAIAKGFRSPTLKELYFDFVDINHNIQGNTTLLAEQSWNYSVHFDWMKQTQKNQLIKIHVGSYYNDIQNLITLGTLQDNVFTFLNVGTYKTIGNQLSFSFRTSKLTVAVNGAYIGRYNPDVENTSVQPFTFSPEIGSTFNYHIFKKRVSLNLFYKFNGRLQSFYVNDEGLIESRIQSSYSILDLSASVLCLKDRQLKLVVGAKNLLNVKQVNVIGQSQGVHSGGSVMNAGRGTSVFMSVRYTLHYSLKNEKD
ncbi:MAG: TonB-dependent receptor [Crocinitomicaceae bacterium]|nr:TonB-dependent receptor [Crocinitomicaceae bacterium]